MTNRLRLTTPIIRSMCKRYLEEYETEPHGDQVLAIHPPEVLHERGMNGEHLIAMWLRLVFLKVALAH